MFSLNKFNRDLQFSRQNISIKSVKVHRNAKHIWDIKWSTIDVLRGGGWCSKGGGKIPSVATYNCMLNTLVE